MAKKTEADENTKRRSSSFAKTSDIFSKQREESEILWKLGRRGEAMSGIQKLLAEAPEDKYLLEMAASYYLDEGNLNKAREFIDRLKKSAAPDDPSVLTLDGGYWVQKKDWKKAEVAFAKLNQIRPEDAEVHRAYAEILIEQRKWKYSRELYQWLFNKRKYRRDDKWNYHRAVDLGAPQFGSRFVYYHRPQGQRDYVIEQKGCFWVAPWLRLGAGLSEEYYKLPEIGEEEAIKRFLMSNSFDATFFYSAMTSFQARWKSTYYKNRDHQELDFVGRTGKGMWRSELEYKLNETPRDPIAAIEKEGTRDTLRTVQRLLIFDRLELGDEINLEWYRVRGVDDQINFGADHLGHKFANDAFVSLTLLKSQPYVAINYRYRQAHWDQKFPGADLVIGYLPDEMVHSGGVYAEYRIGSFWELNASVTRGSDHKRRVDFLIWNFQTEIWVRDYCKVSGTFEYDYGDSGTSGPGNTQIMSCSATFYFL
ncbi:MAG: hypothetical protein PHN49_03080 [Candidatus Omnitrophica bacterium]|nr:hypothetical protein [Candidatus Omnitrophota bacterium]